MQSSFHVPMGIYYAINGGENFVCHMFLSSELLESPNVPDLHFRRTATMSDSRFLPSTGYKTQIQPKTYSRLFERDFNRDKLHFCIAIWGN